ncbi:gamma-glutamylcyclotransferase [Brucella pituitosa]|jgi:cation transport protein ChaC|uniref:glutathione-specific gamma-glutamylcyclotransferase n=1 Tax=Brucella pituitosa TaxID=571256 RepID=A0ABS3JVK5_9HYPH|nr:gamma-glutamylcyclotransferase [Brucella pituitosa]PRA58079.1 gamma-glutamylcyclotransferase [Ochrobactrum sp. MYb68]PRA89356.1 gamma-glutamylcyclotransferase [Ochrobactrum sp. MYb29]MBO1038090.1 gamma-glutamylcyclotransferase [Brucella pituitosa]MCK4205755.1 gamma-glutamylcyclotransferase [Brucella pituitosa]PJO47875.1 gamma-glutamylcyclotransferase [Brucella pituitosa]
MTRRIDDQRMNDFWVFGYGSLMWRPGFAHVETMRARLHGYRRSLCIYSHVHRGTPDHPGLVLGLDTGGSCLGIAFRVPGDMTDEVMIYLREREMSNQVYHEKWLRLRLADGRDVQAVTYVADRRHTQYAGSLKAEDAAAIVATAQGDSGANVDYVSNTLEHLRNMRVRDHALEHVNDLICNKVNRQKHDAA